MSKIVKLGLSVLLISLLIGCKAADTLEDPVDDPTAAPVNKTLELLQSMKPAYEVYFDGEECLVEINIEPTMGEHLLKLYNKSDRTTNMWLASIHDTHTWEDHEEWYQENCGPPGSDCDGSCPFVTWYFPLKEAVEGDDIRYKLFNFPQERVYFIGVEVDNQYSWNCEYLQVNK